MKWDLKGVILISVKMIAKVISIHAVLVLVLLFFSFIQIEFGHAVLYCILRFPLISRLFTLKLHTYLHPIEKIFEFTIEFKKIWSQIWIIYAKTYSFEAVDYQNFWGLKWLVVVCSKSQCILRVPQILKRSHT